MIQKVTLASLAALLLGSAPGCCNAICRARQVCKQPRKVPSGNYYKMMPGVWRGGQPDMRGLYELKCRRFKTIINHRRHDITKRKLAGLGFNYIHLPAGASPSDIPTFLKVLKLAQDSRLHPIYCHCKSGRTRVAILAALHRVLIRGWPPERAFAETERQMGKKKADLLRHIFKGVDWAELREKLRAMPVPRVEPIS